MSEETKQQFKIMGEDINKLKIDITEIKGDVKLIVKTLEDHIKEEGEYRKKQDEFHKAIEEGKANKKDVEKLEDNQKWVIRVVLTLVITALMGLVLIK
jgi:uncharacterized membrane protein (DUF106 family)